MNEEKFYKELSKLKGKFCLTNIYGMVRTKNRYSIGGYKRAFCPIEMVHKNLNKSNEPFDSASEILGMSKSLTSRILSAADDTTIISQTRQKILKVLGLKGANTGC